ncbi:MAG TPA: HD-GYP domain-containing protein [Vicinamibacterales bacterium]|nr:HD-GYP domain-containing protein [Vicinamibacterales bacterium]
MALKVVKQFEKVNRELWVVFSMFIIAAVMNFVVSGQRMVLAFYTLPTVFSAYHYGRRHATLTAFASVLLVVLLVWANPIIVQNAARFQGEQWLDIVVWGGILLVTGYTMGSLYEHKDKQLHELRETYLGILMILRQFISNDKYTENHSYRVSVYATKIAAQLNLDAERIEDIRAAALLHDIGKLDVSRQILYKAARLTESEVVQMQEHVSRGAAILEPVGGSLRRVLPIILSHHDKFDGSGYTASQGENIPIEARVIMVADVFDSLTSDRPYRKAMAPHEARETIMQGSGKEFDPKVVDAFVMAYRKGELEIPAFVV